MGFMNSIWLMWLIKQPFIAALKPLPLAAWETEKSVCACLEHTIPSHALQAMEIRLAIVPAARQTAAVHVVLWPDVPYRKPGLDQCAIERGDIRRQQIRDLGQRKDNTQKLCWEVAVKKMVAVRAYELKGLQMVFEVGQVAFNPDGMCPGRGL